MYGVYHGYIAPIVNGGAMLIHVYTIFVYLPMLGTDSDSLVYALQLAKHKQVHVHM